MVMDFLAGVILYLAPMYFANSSAMLLGGKTPLDLGKKFPDGRPIFGKGKTFKGFFFGTLIGTLAAFVINLLFEAQVASLLPDYMLLGFLLSLGAILGDMAGSFLKRRIGMAPGKPAFFLDQLDFVAGGILLGLPEQDSAGYKIKLVKKKSRLSRSHADSSLKKAPCHIAKYCSKREQKAKQHVIWQQRCDLRFK